MSTVNIWAQHNLSDLTLVGALVVEGNEVGELNNKISRKRILAAEKSHALQIQDRKCISSIPAILWAIFTCDFLDGVNPNPSSPALQYGKRPYGEFSNFLTNQILSVLIPWTHSQVKGSSRLSGKPISSTTAQPYAMLQTI